MENLFYSLSFIEPKYIYEAIFDVGIRVALRILRKEHNINVDKYIMDLIFRKNTTNKVR